jgi:DNA (cytosine-5)-methyltransferase 1
MKASELTVTDQFCGAGGSSVGAELVGLKLRLAMNHWSRAIETHSSNFPNADHVCADISSTEPRRYPSTHVLITSPECTNHSQAKTKKAMATLFSPNGAAEAERSRATMMDVPRFAEYHSYEIIVVENVVEVVRWAGFTPWIQYMSNLGYENQIVCLNSLVAHPTPQSRDRLYVVFWKRGNPRPNLQFCPRSWCPQCRIDVDGVQSFRRTDRHIGKYRQQYDYRCATCTGVVYPYAYPASSAIDWALPTQRIGDRIKPLAAATRRRVEVGLERFGQPAIIQAAGHTYEAPGSGYVRAWSVGDPIPAQTATLSHALALPAWLLSVARQDDMKRRPWSIGDPFPTQTTQLELAIATAFIAELRGGHSDARAVGDPLATVCASGQHHALVTPAFYVKNYGKSEGAGAMAHSVQEPLGTVTSVDHHSVVTMPFLTSYYGTGGSSSVAEPVPTVTTRDRHALVDSAHSVDDCGFRMLEPHEIQAAMAFRADYRVTGNKREQVRQLGNAVTPPVMRMLLERCVETLA